MPRASMYFASTEIYWETNLTYFLEIVLINILVFVNKDSFFYILVLTYILYIHI
jgi:hypothetical protein